MKRGCCWGGARRPTYQQESLLEESAEKAFYGSEEEDAKDAKAEVASLAKRKPYVMDPDHRLLLRNTKPLLQSRNAAVSPPLQPCPSPKATGGLHQPGLMMSPQAKKPPGCLRDIQGWASPGSGFLQVLPGGTLGDTAIPWGVPMPTG